MAALVNVRQTLPKMMEIEIHNSKFSSLGKFRKTERQSSVDHQDKKMLWSLARLSALAMSSYETSERSRGDEERGFNPTLAYFVTSALSSLMFARGEW